MHNFMNMGLGQKVAVGIVSLGLIGAGVWLYTTSRPITDEQVFCTADAMQCPDGSYVGRSGPNCEFQCP